VLGYLKRLLTTGAAYQLGDVLAKAIAVVTIPLYTRHVSRAGYGAANSLLTAVILSSIFLRAGVGEAFIRFYFDDDDADAVAANAQELGGTVVVAPFDAPWVRTTVIADPQGATFIASKFVPENKDLISAQASPAQAA